MRFAKSHGQNRSSNGPVEVFSKYIRQLHSRKGTKIALGGRRGKEKDKSAGATLRPHFPGKKGRHSRCFGLVAEKMIAAGAGFPSVKQCFRAMVHETSAANFWPVRENLIFRRHKRQTQSSVWPCDARTLAAGKGVSIDRTGWRKICLRQTRFVRLLCLRLSGTRPLLRL